MSVCLHGVEDDRRPILNEGILEREATISNALGDHPRITNFYSGLEVFDNTSKSRALYLERASPPGHLRQIIVKGPDGEKPSIEVRLSMIADFAVFFNRNRVKLCDFGDALLDGATYAVIQAYEMRYVPTARAHWNEIPMVVRELSALSSAISETTEWKVPYDDSTTEQEAGKMLDCGELPVLDENNPARDVIMRCWSEHISAQESWAEHTLAVEVYYGCKQLLLARRRRSGSAHFVPLIKPCFPSHHSWLFVDG